MYIEHDGSAIYPKRGHAWFFAPQKGAPAHLYAGLAGDAVVFDLGLADALDVGGHGMEGMGDGARARLLTLFGQILDETLEVDATAVVDVGEMRNSPVIWFGINPREGIVRTGKLWIAPFTWRDMIDEYERDRDDERIRPWTTPLFGRRRT